MNEELAGVETPEANALVENEGVSESPPEQQPVAENEGEAAPAEQKGDDASVPPDVQDAINQRIAKITREKHEALRRAERAEKKLKQAEGRNLDDLDYDDQIAEKTLNRSRREQIENDRETVQELAYEAYQARAEITARKYPDFAEVAGNPSLPITPAMAEAIMDSDHGPEVAYHLGKNPNEAARIARLNPVSQARELGRIEAIVSSARPATKTASAPVNPVGARAAPVRKDPAKMSMSEYIAWRGGK
jgi:hypothetical protein